MGNINQFGLIGFYMKLPYTRIVQEMDDESGHYFYGRILELETADNYNEKISVRFPKICIKGCDTYYNIL